MSRPPPHLQNWRFAYAWIERWVAGVVVQEFEFRSVRREPVSTPAHYAGVQVKTDVSVVAGYAAASFASPAVRGSIQSRARHRIAIPAPGRLNRLADVGSRLAQGGDGAISQSREVAC